MPTGGDPNVDINDVYAFQNPTKPGRTDLVLTVNGLAEAGEPGFFASGVPSVSGDERVYYYLYVDQDGDAIADVTYRIRFGKVVNGVQTFEVRRNGKVLIGLGQGRTTKFGANPRVISGKMNTKVFAGMSDDPFFFDLPGFLNITAALDGDPANDSTSLIGCTGSRPDFFAGKNVSSIVIEVPDSQLGSGTVGIWAATRLGGEQVDRMGLPALATVFIPANPFEPNEPSMKSTYNHAQPKDDVATFSSEFVDTLTLLYSLNDSGGAVGGTDDPADDAGKITGLTDALLPDLLPIDLSSSTGFLGGGRALADDVIDAELGLVTEGLVTTDCVAGNDVTFRSGFPYVAAPHA
jgi:hypothetical protein